MYSKTCGRDCIICKKGYLITTDHNFLNVENESRRGHKNSKIVQERVQRCDINFAVSCWTETTESKEDLENNREYTSQVPGDGKAPGQVERTYEDSQLFWRAEPTWNPHSRGDMGKLHLELLQHSQYFVEPTLCSVWELGCFLLLWTEMWFGSCSVGHPLLMRFCVPLSVCILRQCGAACQVEILCAVMLNKWRRLFHSSRVTFPLVNMSATWSLVSILRIWIFGSKFILSNPKNSEVWIDASLSSKTYSIKLGLDGMWSMFVGMTLVCLTGMEFLAHPTYRYKRVTKRWNAPCACHKILSILFQNAQACSKTTKVSQYESISKQFLSKLWIIPLLTHFLLL